MEKKGLFLREATGLVRTLGTKEAFLINTAILNPGVGFIYLMFALAFSPNADATVALLIAGVTAIFLALCYSQLTAAMPRSGGDFVFTSRLLHPLIGAMVGGAGIFVFLTVCGTNSATFGLLFLPQTFSQMGAVFNSPGLTALGTTLGTPWAAFITTVILVVLAGFVMSLGLKRVSQVMWVLFAIGMLGFLSMLVINLISSREQFVAAFNSASAVTAGGNAYQQILDTAKSQGFVPGVSFMGILLAVPYCAMVYWGFTSANYPGGELKDASKTLMASTLIALGVGAVLLIISWEAVKRMVGLDFMQSQNWLALNHADVYGGITTAPTQPNYYASVLAGKSLVAILIPFSYLCWIASFNLAYYVVISRVIFAMSFDRLLPDIALHHDFGVSRATQAGPATRTTRRVLAAVVDQQHQRLQLPFDLRAGLDHPAHVLGRVFGPSRHGTRQRVDHHH